MYYAEPHKFSCGLKADWGFCGFQVGFGRKSITYHLEHSLQNLYGVNTPVDLNYNYAYYIQSVFT